MAGSIHLGYTCAKCWTRVPVYTFARLNGETVATPPEDRTVECPNCHLPRTITFTFLQYLDRWEGTAESLPQSPAPEPTTSTGGGAKFYREFTRGTCGTGIPLDYRRAQLVKGTDGCIYVVSPDGTTVIFRDDAARQLGERFHSEQSKNGAGEWDFCIRLDIQIAAPVGR